MEGPDLACIFMAGLATLMAWWTAYLTEQVRKRANRLVVRAEWDSAASVWVANSDDVPGLVTEGETIEALYAKLMDLVPSLLVANGQAADAAKPIELIARRSSGTLPRV